MENYEYPEIFIRGAGGPPYIVKKGEEYLLKEQDVGREHVFYGHVLYEDVLARAIDLLEGRVKEEFIVIPRFTGAPAMKALLIEKGRDACIMEISGVQPYTGLREGVYIEKHEKAGYIVTGKGEVRGYKSPCTGIVVVVANLAWEKPEKYVVVVVSRDAVREIIVRKAP